MDNCTFQLMGMDSELLPGINTQIIFHYLFTCPSAIFICRSNILHIFGTETSKSFSLINKYCKFQIPEILYFSTDGHKVVSFCQALGQHITLNRTCEIAFDLSFLHDFVQTEIDLK